MRPQKHDQEKNYLTIVTEAMADNIVCGHDLHLERTAGQEGHKIK